MDDLPLKVKERFLECFEVVFNFSILSVFKIESTANGEEVGKLKKQFSGMAKEVFTDADNFSVTCEYSQLLHAHYFCSQQTLWF